MGLLKGISVVLICKTQDGTDDFNRPVLKDARHTVDNVLVSPVSQTDTAVVDELKMNGKRVLYQLAIPKEDTHSWEDAEVEFFGATWKTTGYSTMGIDHLIPLGWNRKVVVERDG